MKRLTLIRHAKSSSADNNYKDQERTLLMEGQEDAKIIAENVLKNFSAPDAFLVSKAVRATETAQIILNNLSFPREIVKILGDLYTFEWYDLLTFVRNLDDSLNSVIIIGHNPALTELINYLSFEKKLINLPTAGVCSLVLEVSSWEEIRKDCGNILLFHFPYEYRSLSHNM